MSATVDIEVATEKNALLIPYASVVTRELDKATDSTSEEHLDGTLTSAKENDPQAGATKEGKKRSDKIKKSGVFVCENGMARFVEVSTGIADERNIVALSGLTPGDTIISGSFKTLRALSDSDLVTIDKTSLDKMADL